MDLNFTRGSTAGGTLVAPGFLEFIESGSGMLTLFVE